MAIEDIGRFVVFAVTSLPADEIEWKGFRIEGDRKSTNQLIVRIPSSKESSNWHLGTGVLV